MRQLIAILIGLTFVAGGLAACTPSDPATATGPESCASAFGLYKCLGVHYGPLVENTAQIVRQDSPGLRPVIIVVHGGGWVAGNFNASDGEDGPLNPAADWTDVVRLVNSGYALMAINYRLSSVNDPTKKAPAAVVDVKAAVRWVKSAQGPNHGLDPTRILLWGHSAGGNLVTLAASSVNIDPSWEPSNQLDANPATNSDVQAVISFAGVYDFGAQISYPGSNIGNVNIGAAAFLWCNRIEAVPDFPNCGPGLYTTWASPRNLVTAPSNHMRHVMLLTSQGTGPGDGIVSRDQSDGYSAQLLNNGYTVSNAGDPAYPTARTLTSCDNVNAGGPGDHFEFSACKTAVEAFLVKYFPPPA